MIWLAVVLLIAGLAFVLFHRPQLNVLGAGWQPARIDPLAQGTTALVTDVATAAGDAEDAVTLRLRRIEATGGWSAEDAVTAPLPRQALESAPADDSYVPAQAATISNTFDVGDLVARDPSTERASV